MPVIASLKGDRAFQRLRRGRAGHAKLLSLRWRAIRESALERANAGAHVDAYVGIVVSKKVGKAVIRNRVRRRLREALKAVLTCAEGRREAKNAVELVIIARPDAAEASYGQLKGSLEHALRKGQLL